MRRNTDYDPITSSRPLSRSAPPRPSNDSFGAPIAPVPIRKSSLTDASQAAIAYLNRNEFDGRDNVTTKNFDSAGGTIPVRGHSSSPIRSTSDQRNPSAVGPQQVPPKTFQRTTIPMDVVDRPELLEPGFLLALKLTSPMFVGGATVEGTLRIDVGNITSRTFPNLLSQTTPINNIALSNITIDVLGIESCRNKKHVFRSIAMELFDETRPPPSSMLSKSKSTQGKYWNLAPSFTELPICLSLPMDVGPPPYKSKHAKIQYIIAVTASIKIDERSCLVRSSQSIDILTVHDRKCFCFLL